MKHADGPKPATKDDLKKEISSLDARTDIKFDKFTRQIKDLLTEFRSDIFTRLDQVMGELSQIREDQLFMFHDIKNLNKRVAKLEKLQGITNEEN